MQPCYFFSQSRSSRGTHTHDSIEFTASREEEARRLDIVLAGRIEDASRSFLKRVIKDGRVHINGEPCARPGRALTLGDRVHVDLPPPSTTELLPEDIPLDVLFEDEHLLVVNKPAGLVVHPAPGHPAGTLVNAVLFHCAAFQRPTAAGEAPGNALRPGIVHRLDRDTSGALVVAKTQVAFNHLSRQARQHTFERRYLAIVQGEFDADSGVIDASIGRSLSDRKRMSITTVNAREAVTRFRVQRRFFIASLIELQLETGRTHQIRVHLRFAGHPMLGDPVYGTVDFASWNIDSALREALAALKGQALHAEHLGLEHPLTGEQMSFTAPLPADLQKVLAELERLQT